MSRLAASLLAIALLAVSGAAAAQCVPADQLRRADGLRRAWASPPGVVVYARRGDERIALTRAAVEHWNRVLEDIGSGLRLGPVRIEPLDAATEGYAEAVSAAVLRRSRLAPWPPPDGLRRHCGNIVVVLTDSRIISVGRAITRLGIALVAIKGMEYEPFTIENVARNVIAHELGHAIGLGHNADPKLLMCGRPAPCRPTLFQSSTPRYFPVGEAARARLRRAYPPG